MLYINWPRTMANLEDELARQQIPKSVFANRIGVSPQSLSRYLACKDRPSVDVFLRMHEEVDFQNIMTLKRG